MAAPATAGTFSLLPPPAAGLAALDHYGDGPAHYHEGQDCWSLHGSSPLKRCKFVDFGDDGGDTIVLKEYIQGLLFPPLMPSKDSTDRADLLTLSPIKHRLTRDYAESVTIALVQLGVFERDYETEQEYLSGLAARLAAAEKASLPLDELVYTADCFDEAEDFDFDDDDTKHLAFIAAARLRSFSKAGPSSSLPSLSLSRLLVILGTTDTYAARVDDASELYTNAEELLSALQTYHGGGTASAQLAAKRLPGFMQAAVLPAAMRAEEWGGERLLEEVVDAVDYLKGSKEKRAAVESKRFDFMCRGLDGLQPWLACYVPSLADALPQVARLRARFCKVSSTEALYIALKELDGVFGDRGPFIDGLVSDGKDGDAIAQLLLADHEAACVTPPRMRAQPGRGRGAFSLSRLA